MKCSEKERKEEKRRTEQKSRLKHEREEEKVPTRSMK